MIKKLYRSRKDSKITGVLDSIAAYLNIDSSIIRSLAVITIFFGGGGIVSYLIAWLIIPLEPSGEESADFSRKTGGVQQGKPETTIDAEIIEDSPSHEEKE